ncbi:MAG: rhamnulokinase [Turicibacter sp.]|nr:rhamnulokinase [Turicibacter sp.]
MGDYLAVDVGASSGRVMLGRLVDGGKIELWEVHRFSNGFVRQDGVCCWEIDSLIDEILTALVKVKQMGVLSCTLGIATWAVDYVLVDKDGKKIKEAVSYRDERTQTAAKKVSQIISPELHYAKTGIQFLEFNTIYQLYTEPPDVMKKTRHILMIPDYLGFCLTGVAVTEYTNATTTALLDYQTKDFDDELLKIISVNREQFAPFAEAGRVLGDILPKFHNSHDLPKCTVIVAATHDTASAVVGTPGFGDDWAFLSSGTWSLLGVELDKAIVNDRARKANYSNEGGICGTYRFLKNIMGMWLIQEIRRLLNADLLDLLKQAEQAVPFRSLINPTDSALLNPQNMIETIQNATIKGMEKPTTSGELVRCVLDSLAILYALTMDELETITEKTMNRLIIIGGGSQNDLLNQLTADMLGKTVAAGPPEATALGNIAVQMMAREGHTLAFVRKLIENSFENRIFAPKSDYRTIERYKTLWT